MKSKISALMDGELERHEAAALLEALRSEGEMRDAWRAYHLIGDAMHDTRLLSAGFSGRVAARLAGEPTVMAPARLAPVERPRWQLLSAAASVAAVAMVTSVWFVLQDGADPASQVAQANKTTAPLAAQATRTAPPAVQATAKAAAPAAPGPPPDSANDYLYAHQGYSPRNSLQGAAPYVRMVSGEARPAK